jgi:hypothetical protein
MKAFKSIFLMFVLFFLIIFVKAQQWNDISINEDDLNTIEYIPETGDFFIGGTGCIYRWDQENWYSQDLSGVYYSSAYNNGLLVLNGTIGIMYAKLEDDFQDWDYYTPEYHIEKVFSYQDKIILLPEETFDYDNFRNIHGLIMSNTGEIVDSLYLPEATIDTFNVHYFLKAGFSVGNEIYVLSYIDNDFYPNYNTTTIYKTSDQGLNWEEVIIFPGRSISAKAKGDTVVISLDDYYNFSRLIKSYDGFETWEVEDIYRWTYVYDVDINNNNIYCAGISPPDGSPGFIYDGNYITFDDWVYGLETVNIATMVVGNNGYAQIRYNYTNIETVSTEYKLGTYPNPFTDVINVSVEENTLVQIYDIRGSLITQFHGKQFNLSDLVEGVYLLKANSKFKKIVKK